MSEPVSNVEIEDVLSSIRRLVSESSGSKDDASTQGEITEKLVLTPAFRVLENPAPSIDTDADDDPRAKILREMAQADRPEITPPAPAPTESSEAESGEGEGLEQRIAELEAAIGETYDEWEPDGSEEDVAEAEPIIFKMAGSAATQEAAPMADIEDVFDNPGEDTVQAEILEPVFNNPERVDDDGILDEEALRDLVAQLVREELQGAIGERITSNVRRMVRREIKRAFAIRDLE